MNQKH